MANTTPARAQLDVSGPINDQLAYRVSYEGIHSGQLLPLSATTIRTTSTSRCATCRARKLTIDFNTEFYSAHYTENTGINRPTQQLIDNGLYYHGTGVSPFTGPGQDPRNFLSVVNVTGVVPISTAR